MTLREPPSIATWLLKRFARGYRAESLLGDLLEEYQAGRTPGWYWRETIAVLLATVMCRTRLLHWRRAVRRIPPLVGQSAVFVGVAVLSEEYRHLCSAASTLLTGSIILVICAVVAEVSIALVAWVDSVRWPIRKAPRSSLARRSIVAFTAIGLGTGALTWANTTSCPPEPHACLPSVAIASCLEPGDGTADGR